MNKTKVISFSFHALLALGLAVYVNVLLGLPVLAGWLVFVNVINFLSFGLDKYRAKKKWRRTPESTFLWLAFLGAFPALFLGRKAFRHKTVKKGFIWPMWLLFTLQLTLVLAVLFGLLPL